MWRRLLTIAVAGLFMAETSFLPVRADDSTTVTMKGTVGNVCHMGDLTNGTIDVGTLTNASDGTLAPVSGSPHTTITGSWCNVGSTITISALPMVARGYSGTPPSGFTKAVNYTATESGWGSPTPSDTSQGDASGADSGNHSGSADVNDPVSNTITVTLSNFSTPAGGDRLVADNDYEGTITVTLNAASP